MVTQCSFLFSVMLQPHLYLSLHKQQLKLKPWPNPMNSFTVTLETWSHRYFVKVAMFYAAWYSIYVTTNRRSMWRTSQTSVYVVVVLLRLVASKKQLHEWVWILHYQFHPYQSWLLNNLSHLKESKRVLRLPEPQFFCPKHAAQRSGTTPLENVLQRCSDGSIDQIACNRKPLMGKSGSYRAWSHSNPQYSLACSKGMKIYYKPYYFTFSYPLVPTQTFSGSPLASPTYVIFPAESLILPSVPPSAAGLPLNWLDCTPLASLDAILPFPMLCQCFCLPPNELFWYLQNNISFLLGYFPTRPWISMSLENLYFYSAQS